VRLVLLSDASLDLTRSISDLRSLRQEGKAHFLAVGSFSRPQRGHFVASVSAMANSKSYHVCSEKSFRVAPRRGRASHTSPLTGSRLRRLPPRDRAMARGGVKRARGAGKRPRRGRVKPEPRPPAAAGGAPARQSIPSPLTRSLATPDSAERRPKRSCTPESTRSTRRSPPSLSVPLPKSPTRPRP